MDDDEKFNKLVENFPDDDVEIPLNKEGSIDYKKVKNLPKNSREEKIIYCALCNKIFGTHMFVTFSTFSDKRLLDNVESYELFWPDHY